MPADMHLEVTDSTCKVTDRMAELTGSSPSIKKKPRSFISFSVFRLF